MNWDFLIVLSPFIAFLEYNSNGKLYDCGMFDTKQAALDKVEFYRMRRADRPVMPTQPI